MAGIQENLDYYIKSKGWTKKKSIFKIWYAIFLWTIGPKRVSFGLVVLMSIPSPEKDSLLGPTVHEKNAYQILKKGFFLPHPLLI